MKKWAISHGLVVINPTSLFNQSIIQPIIYFGLLINLFQELTYNTANSKLLAFLNSNYILFLLKNRLVQ